MHGARGTPPRPAGPRKAERSGVTFSEVHGDRRVTGQNTYGTRRGGAEDLWNGAGRGSDFLSFSYVCEIRLIDVGNRYYGETTRRM